MVSRTWVPVVLLVGLFAGMPRLVQAQPTPSPKDIVRQAVQTEMAADRDDHTRWRYRDVEKTPTNKVSIVVETDQGSLKKKIEENGHPLTPEEESAEMKRLNNFISDPSLQAKQRRDGQHDDQSARELLQMLPEAFDWKVVNENGKDITLSFEPNPNFSPPDMESRVMGGMGGQMVVDKAQHRIVSIRGTLLDDVTFGFGLLGRLHKGGTFNVERREIAPGLWQITETHVHIDGRALLFKTIGEQQDEVKSDFTRVPNGTTLAQAEQLLNQPVGGTCMACMDKAAGQR